MRLWSIHPSYLDAKGLVALWREGLLAKHVLEGKTKGYKNHPQLLRFKKGKDPVLLINNYLAAVAKEAESRGYRFDTTKISPKKSARKMTVTDEQLGHERKHLQQKLAKRDPARIALLPSAKDMLPHPLFQVVKGSVETWEKIADAA